MADALINCYCAAVCASLPHATHKAKHLIIPVASHIHYCACNANHRKYCVTCWSRPASLSVPAMPPAGSGRKDPLAVPTQVGWHCWFPEWHNVSSRTWNTGALCSALAWIMHSCSMLCAILEATAVFLFLLSRRPWMNKLRYFCTACDQIEKPCYSCLASFLLCG